MLIMTREGFIISVAVPTGWAIHLNPVNTTAIKENDFHTSQIIMFDRVEFKTPVIDRHSQQLAGSGKVDFWEKCLQSRRFHTHFR